MVTSPNPNPARVLSLLLALCFLTGKVTAAPYGPGGLETEWEQPDGAKLALRVFGDEFYARTETADGFTVVYDPADRAYHYADVSPDGVLLVAGATMAHLKAPGGLARHLALPETAILKKSQFNRARFDADRAARWAQRVQAVREQRAAPAPGEAQGESGAVPVDIAAAPVNGAKVGLTVLVQFPDDTNTPVADPVNFPTDQAKIIRYCNNPGYTEDGNTGSVRDYFYDQSLGTLTYTQSVTQIVTLPNARNYYNYSDYPANLILRDNGEAGRLVIQHAIAELETAGFDFSTLSVDSGNKVIATNVLFAGNDSGVWAQGLWPHSWSMPWPGINVGTVPNPKYIYSYQITNTANASPVIGTFVHENGHLLLGYPDLYDYGGDSEGVGNHCLMGAGNHNNGGRTPATLNAYFKDIVGWANVVDFTATQSTVVSVPTTGNVACRIRKPGLATEYFIVENHGSGDKWANSLPDKGIAIWHIDENKSGNDEQQMSSSLHYEVSLEQADGLFDMENNLDRGDAQDLFDSNDPDFNNLTLPNANWWDGTASDIRVRVTSLAGAGMNVEFGDQLPPNTIVVTSPNGGGIFYHGNTATVTWDSNTSGDVKIELLKSGVPHAVLSASESNDGIYSWTVSAGLPAGTDYTLKISSVANPSYWDSSDADFEIKAQLTLEEALDAPLLTWTTGGNSNWIPQITTTHDGMDAAQSGPMTDSQSNYVQTPVTGPGTLTFWWKISSEGSYDFLRFYVDGVEQAGSLAKISGEVAWVQKTATITSGSHTLKWAYTKDYSVSSGSDAAWVDQVVFTPTPKPEIVVEQPLGTDLVDGAASLDCGSLNLGSSSETFTFTVKNTGTANLTGIAITQDGPASADFTVVGPAVTTLAPNETTTFTVAFTPGAAGTRNAAIHIASSDADENPFDIVLTATGVAVPEIAVEQPPGTGLADGTTSLGYGGVNLGSSSDPITFTIKNTGTADLTGLAITRTGPESDDFAVTGPAITTLAPNETTVFTVVFTPGSAGGRIAAIHITSNDADENPFDIDLSGTGVAVPEIVVEQPLGTDLVDGTSSLDCGSVNLGSLSETFTFIVKNSGTADLTGLAITQDGPENTDFAVTGPVITTLAPNETTTFTVAFTPGAAGARNAAIHIASNDADENPFDILLTGTGVGMPEIVVEQPLGTDLTDGTASLDCGSVNLGSSSETFTFTVKNTGTADLTGLAITQDGPESTDYTVTGPAITTLAPNETAIFTIVFTPGAAGLRNAALYITSNDADETPFDIGLTGTGVGMPEIVVEQPLGTDLVDGTASLDCSSVNLGSSSEAFTFTVNNSGTADLTGLAITQDGPESTDYTVTGPAVTTLAPNETTTFTVAFTPGAAGARNAAIHIASNDADEYPFDIVLTGTGVGMPEIVVEQPLGTDLADGIAGLDCSSVSLGSSSETFTFTVKNTGTADLTGLAITQDGPASADFTVVGPAVTTLAPNETTTFIVTFTPGAAGSRTAAIHIASSDADENPFDIVLTGTGVGIPEIVLEQPLGTDLVDGTASLDCGSVNLGSSSETITFTVKNTGTADLTGLAITQDGPESTDFTVTGLAITTLAPNETISFTVAFTPGAAGVRNAAIHIASNDADENPFDIVLTGAGVGIPEIVLEQPLGTDLVDGTASLDCGSVNLGSTSDTFTFTIKNTGTADLTGIAITQTGPESTDYTVTDPAATTLAPNETTTFTAAFAPGSAGARIAAIHIASNDADENPFDIDLSGAGVAVPEIVVEQPLGTDLADGTASLDCGSVNLGSTSEIFSLTIKNTGTADLTGLAITHDGPESTDYTVTGPAVTTLAPNETTTFTVAFTPGAAGARNAAIHIASNDADENPFDIALTGTGVGMPEIVVEQPLGTDLADGTASLDCGSVNLGSSSETFTFILKNTGTADLTGLAIIQDGPESTDYTVTGPAITTLAPTETITFTVAFTPGAAGARNAAIHIASNDADENPFDIALTGTGLAPVESWRFANFSTTENMGDAADDADPDGDGLSNLIEYGFKTNPNVAGNNPVTCQKSGDSFFIIYPRNIAASDVLFTIDRSSDLGTADPWFAATVDEEILGTDEGVQQVKATLALPPETPRTFLRVRLSLVP